MSEVDGKTFVPALLSHRFERLPVVARGVVDEDTDGAEFGHRLIGCGPHGLDIAKVCLDEMRRLSGLRRDLLAERQARFRCDVHEGDAGALAGERLHQCGPYAGAAAGDQNSAIAQVGKLAARQSHGFSPIPRLRD